MADWGAQVDWGLGLGRGTGHCWLGWTGPGHLPSRHGTWRAAEEGKAGRAAGGYLTTTLLLLVVYYDEMDDYVHNTAALPSRPLLAVRFLLKTTKSLAALPPCCLASSWTSCQLTVSCLDRGGSRWIPEWPAICKVGRRHRLILGGQGDLPAANTLSEGFHTSEATSRHVWQLAAR